MCLIRLRSNSIKQKSPVPSAVECNSSFRRRQRLPCRSSATFKAFRIVRIVLRRFRDWSGEFTETIRKLRSSASRSRYVSIGQRDVRIGKLFCLTEQHLYIIESASNNSKFFNKIDCLNSLSSRLPGRLSPCSLPIH